MATKRDIRDWEAAGYDYARDELYQHKGGPVSTSKKQQIEGCAYDLMDGDDEAAAHAVEGMHRAFKEKEAGK